MKNLLLFITSILVFGCSKNEQVIINKPFSTQESSTIRIGNHIWSKKNLDVVIYRNGDTIPQVTDSTEWTNLTTGAWCYYNNDPRTGEIYGKLYNWYAVNDPRGLAPEGYRIPSETDIIKLIEYLGGDTIAGSKLKESGLSHWKYKNDFGTDNFNFRGLPGGIRGENGDFCGIGTEADWWTSSYFLPNLCHPEGSGGIMYILGEYWANGNFKKLYKSSTILSYGCSVRCIKN